MHLGVLVLYSTSGPLLFNDFEQVYLYLGGSVSPSMNGYEIHVANAQYMLGTDQMDE